ncbi:carbohydrate sulfotransferase 15-like [Myxocyprinus asiaticus]|uniref:carbohydrate sulfotransferase 15-like n=1 Tax=Myxocyprinus asiaticus TaxID=70543 RepID=UPI002223974A|nr:carbohydrate sulfotransferase 15-like [Myxocyprinus asiaticus]XP_051578614.1 carbohydrate sulfotransferase 15-like [Myxocyprinus asiaticus]XP_051578615.1 carbohydrate sulfotransferase 15-like [Myxocyprinus asiaticus]
MEHKYGLLSAPYEKLEPAFINLDNKWTKVLTIIDNNRVHHQAWGPWTIGSVRKVKILSFVFGLIVTVLIMASYILTRDQKGLFLTPSPYQITVLSQPAHMALDISSNTDYTVVREVVRSIMDKVDFSRRRVPDLGELREKEPQILSAIPRKFLPSLKNPCWYEEFFENISADPYGKNLYALYSKRFQAIYDHLRRAFPSHLHQHAGRHYRLRCLPFFYIIGQPKCGTTDLYDRLRLHPEVHFTTMKEPHWWTRKRFGIIRLSNGFHNPYPLKDYLDLFDQAANQIQDHLISNSSKSHKEVDIIIGEASASTMWDNNAWIYFYDNGTGVEPPFLVQDFIHAVQPDAKFIVMLRDPVERLYSDYLYFGMTNKSVEDFHERVSESLQLFEACLAERSIRSCIYNTTLNNLMPVRLQVGLYVMYLLDWLSVFNREQLLILRLEDHAANRKNTMRRVFDFLQLGPLTLQKEADITKSPASNTRRPANRNLGPMLPITKEILHSFYRPFNQHLTQVLRDPAFLWM